PSSRPATTALASRSQENTEPGLFQRGRIRIDQRAGLELVRIEHDLLARAAELLDAVALDLLVLDHQRATARPLAVLAELDLADDRVEFGRADVVRDLLLIEAL